MASRTVRAVLVAAIVAGIVVVPVGAATAAELVPSASAVPPDFTPSPNKWRQYIVNQLSGVLGKVTPNKWRAEQIANQYRYAGDFEQLNASLGIDGVHVDANGNMTGIKWTERGTGTYQDVVIDGLEKQYKTTAARGKGAVRVPATAGKALMKVAGGALTAVTFYELSSGLTAWGLGATAGWIGWDPNGTVCQMTSDGSIGSWVMRTASGQNCDGWDMAHEYTPNLDQPDDYSPLSFGSFSLAFAKVGTVFPAGAKNLCWTGSPPPTGYPSLGGGYSVYSDTSTKAGPARRSAPAYNIGRGCTTVQYASAADHDSITGYGNGLPYVMNDATGEVVAEVTVTKGDPKRTEDCTVTATDGTSVTGPASDAVSEGSGKVGGPVCPDVPAGKVPDSVSVTQHTPGAPDAKLYDEKVSDDAKKMFSQYQECMYGACALDLIKLDDPGAPSCFDLDKGCPGWWQDPLRADHYQCRYGIHNVEIQQCAVYSGLFEPGRVAIDAPYSDPTTGEWSGAKNTPAQGETAMSAGVQDPSMVRGCDLSDIGFDPIGWVVRPLQCALQWAFVPRPAVVQASAAGSGEAWSSKPPAVIAAAVGDMSAAANSEGCSRSVTLFGTGPWHAQQVKPIDACPGSYSESLAAASRLIVSAAAVVVAVVLLRRQIAGMVGYNRGQ